MVISHAKILKKKTIIALLVLIVLLSMVFHGYFSKATKAYLNANASLKAEEYIALVMKEAITGKTNNLFYEEKSLNGITRTQFNTEVANEILFDSLNELRFIAGKYNEKGKFTFRLPTTYLFLPTSFIFQELTIPVTCSQILHYDVELASEIKEYGINNSLVALNLIVCIQFQVMIPFITETVDTVVLIPLALEIINGEVPQVLFTY